MKSAEKNMKLSKLPKQAAPVLRQSTSSAPIADGSGVEASGFFDDVVKVGTDVLTGAGKGALGGALGAIG